MLLNTVLMSLFVGAGVTVVGVGTAWLVAACRFRGSRAFAWLLVLPLAMPAYIIAYAYADLTAFAGPLQTALARPSAGGAATTGFPRCAVSPAPR